MYIKLGSGKTAVIGQWPTAEELQEVDEIISEVLPNGLVAEQKVIVISNDDAPITRTELDETKQEIINHIASLDVLIRRRC